MNFLEKTPETASLILAAGRGSRMKGFNGSKTLLPLIAEKSPFEGSRPILMEILDNLPPGPKAVVVNHKKEDVMEASKGYNLSYWEQPVLNGTGGALLAAHEFVRNQPCSRLIITMGDVPLVKPRTYRELVRHLTENCMVVLGFQPEDKKQYGLLRTDGHQVRKIIEWKYWKTFPPKQQNALRICNSGIYAVRKDTLLRYLSLLASNPHIVRKEIDGKLTDVEEFFVTDLVEYMCNDGLPVGYVTAHEEELMGVDDLSAVLKVQELYKKRSPQSRN